MSTFEVVPVLLTGEEVEGSSADCRVGVNHLVGGCDHHQRGDGHLGSTQVWAEWGGVGGIDPRGVVLPPASVRAAVVDEPAKRLDRLQQ